MCAIAAVFALGNVCHAQPAAQAQGENQESASQPTGAGIVNVHGYPELIVDGHPFFIHAAEFSYYRVPRDLWARSLDRYRDLGINTIDLRIPWNWHEPREGELDFDGHTNPRRDLRGLLALISEKGFRLIVRPGPIIGDEWLNGGYPAWLLARAEYQMPETERLDGLFPPAARTEASDAGAGATQWLENATHMRYATQWIAAVARELAPYSSTKTKEIPQPADTDHHRKDDPPAKKSSGPLLFVFLEDSATLKSDEAGVQRFWEYIQKLREALVAGGVEARFSVTAAQAENGFVHGTKEAGIGVAGEWFLKPGDNLPGGDTDTRTLRLSDSDAQTLALLAQSLRTQPEFPAFLGNFQAGWLTPPDDSSPLPSPPFNTLLSSRWLMAQGMGGIEYSPLQESLTPPGYQTVRANREFRWNAALDLTGERQPRAHAVERNAQSLKIWGEFLASAHPRAGIGLVDLRWDLSQTKGLPRQEAESTAAGSRVTLRQVERIAIFAGLPVDIVDPASQTSESLLRHPLLLLIIPDSVRGKEFLPAQTQAALLDYVRHGGALVCNPERPVGALFDEALRGASTEIVRDGLRTTRVGAGKIFEWSKDFYSWVDTSQSFAASLAREESSWAIAELQRTSFQVNLKAPVVQSDGKPSALLVTELLANESSGPLGSLSRDCASQSRCAQGLLSVTNWGSDDSISETLKVLPPNLDSRVTPESDYIELPVQIPPRESLLLPLNVPICSEDSSPDACKDRIVAAGAEVLGMHRDGKALILTFYAPSSATVLLRLREIPGKVDLPAMMPGKPHLLMTDEPRQGGRGGRGDLPPMPTAELNGTDFPERTLDGNYNLTTGIFEVQVPRGAAPHFLRELRIHLNYVPDVPELKKPGKRKGQGYRYSVADAVRLPLGEGTSLPSDPPIISLDKDHNGQLLIETENQDDSPLNLQATVDGPVHGTEALHMRDREDLIETLKIRGTAGTAPDDPPPAGLLRGTVSLNGDRNGDRSSPIEFLAADAETPVHYEYDFERSGAKNWVIENKRLRLVFQPAAGGQAVALVDKQTGFNMTTTVGGFRDLLRLPAAASGAKESALMDTMFNVPYSADWGPGKEDVAIHMTARWPEGVPVSGEIAKTIRMTGKDGKDLIEVDYDLGKSAPRGETNPGAAIVTAFSVPAVEDKGEATQFCWTAAAPAQGTTPDGKETADSTAATCVKFVRGAALISIPAEAVRLEIRTPGRPTLAMEWTAGRVSIEQKRLSARILVEFPALHANGDAAHYVLRYTVQQAP